MNITKMKIITLFLSFFLLLVFTGGIANALPTTTFAIGDGGYIDLPDVKYSSKALSVDPFKLAEGQKSNALNLFDLTVHSAPSWINNASVGVEITSPTQGIFGTSAKLLVWGTYFCDKVAGIYKLSWIAPIQFSYGQHKDGLATLKLKDCWWSMLGNSTTIKGWITNIKCASGDPLSVPEPETFLLFGVGIIGLMLLESRRHQS